MPIGAPRVQALMPKQRFDTSVRICAAITQLAGIVMVLAPFVTTGESALAWWSATLCGALLIVLAAVAINSLEAGRTHALTAPYPASALVGGWLVVFPWVGKPPMPYFDASLAAGALVLAISALQAVLALWGRREAAATRAAHADGAAGDNP